MDKLQEGEHFKYRGYLFRVVGHNDPYYLCRRIANKDGVLYKNATTASQLHPSWVTPISTSELADWYNERIVNLMRARDEVTKC